MAQLILSIFFALIIYFLESLMDYNQMKRNFKLVNYQIGLIYNVINSKKIIFKTIQLKVYLKKEVLKVIKVRIYMKIIFKIQYKKIVNNNNSTYLHLNQLDIDQRNALNKIIGNTNKELN